MSTNAARNQNRDALNAVDKDIGLAELDGFQLPSDVTEEFLERMQEEVAILDMVHVQTLERLEQEVPKFGVPMLSGSGRDEEGSRTDASDAESGHVKYNATDKSYYILFEPKRDAIKNTHYGEGQWGQLILDEFSQRWGNDVGLIGIRAGASTGHLDDLAGRDDLDTRFTGWIARAEEDTASDRIGLEDTAAADTDSMPELDWTDDEANPQPVDTTMFHEAIQRLDNRYRDPTTVQFLTSPDQVQQYHYDLTDREDGLGVAVLQGDSDVTPFDYDVVGVNGWPSEYAMLTDPTNLSFGLFEEMELEQTTDSDKVHEDKLHSRNWLEGQMDFQIREMQAGVLITGLENPIA